MIDPRWRLDGQRALVTGASAGIGLAIARELLHAGAEVLLVARDADRLAAARDELAEQFPDSGIDGLAADVCEGEDRRAILDWVEDGGDGLHLLVNNAGGRLDRATVDYTEDEWRGLFEANLFSAFELARYAHPLLARHPASAIVNIGSVAGHIALPGGAPQGMSKAALEQMTRALAVEWARDGVRVNAVLPWDIRTQGRASTPGSGRRPGEPEDVAAAAAFLCLPAAAYITGQCLAVDGGLSAGGGRPWG